MEFIYFTESHTACTILEYQKEKSYIHSFVRLLLQ